MIIHQHFNIFRFCCVFSHNIIYHIHFYSTYCHHVQGNWSFLKYNWSKIFTLTLKRPVLSSSTNHTSYTSNLTRTIILSQLENEDSNTIQNTMETSNTDDIHSCATPQKQNISVQATYTPPCSTPLHITLPIAPVELQKAK